MVMSRRSAHRLFALGASDVDNPLQRMLDRRCDKRPDEQTLNGNTVIWAFGAREATSIEVCSGCPGMSSGSTNIGVRQCLMKSRDTLYRKSGCTAYRLCRYCSIVLGEAADLDRRAGRTGPSQNTACARPSTARTPGSR
jgi:hypothetical protein